MRASLSKVCFLHYTMPTQTFRYYPGYPFIKYLPKNSLIATRPNLSLRISHEKNSTTILSLPLIQEGQLSVTGERMGTKYW